MNSSAFTLLELVLALALFAISSVVAAGFLATTGVWACKTISVLRNDCATALALDVVMRDVMSARNDLKYWDVEHNVFMHEIVDDKGVLHTSWVGWDVVKQGLRRKQGAYDRTQHKWKQATSSVIGCGLKEFTLQPKTNRESGTIVVVTMVCAMPRTVRLGGRESS